MRWPFRAAAPPSAGGSPDGAGREGMPLATIALARPTGLGLQANASGEPRAAPASARAHRNPEKAPLAGDYLALSIASGTSTVKRCVSREGTEGSRETRFKAPGCVWFETFVNKYTRCCYRQLLERDLRPQAP